MVSVTKQALGCRRFSEIPAGTVGAFSPPAAAASELRANSKSSFRSS